MPNINAFKKPSQTTLKNSIHGLQLFSEMLTTIAYINEKNTIKTKLPNENT